MFSETRLSIALYLHLSFKLKRTVCWRLQIPLLAATLQVRIAIAVLILTDDVLYSIMKNELNLSNTTEMKCHLLDMLCSTAEL